MKHWWMFSDEMLPIRVALWWLRWKIRGHDKNHDRRFCQHRSKVWLWEMNDGCRGLVCDWCHLLEPWCPTFLPDVSELMRVRSDGSPDPDWRPAPLIERFRDAWEQLEKDLNLNGRLRRNRWESYRL